MRGFEGACGLVIGYWLFRRLLDSGSLGGELLRKGGGSARDGGFDGFHEEARHTNTY